MVTINVPAVVLGQVRRKGDDSLPIVTSQGETILVGQLTPDLFDELTASPRSALGGLTFQEVVAFLNRVGRFWLRKEYPRRAQYIRYMVQAYGYSEKAAEVEADLIGILLTQHARMYDMVDTELGSRFILDDWIRREECYVRAFPRGRSVHVLAGNVPMSSVGSIIRALLTKNVCIVKPASDDLITPWALAMSFLDVDPDHPIAQSLSVVYWHGAGGELSEALVESADAVVVWGGMDAVSWARRCASPLASFLAFGPKRSIALVGRDASIDQAAQQVAHDVCAYDQKGCFSTQHAFVERPTEGFVDALTDWLSRYDELLPRGAMTDDDHARIRLAAVEEQFLGNEFRCSEVNSWLLIVAGKAQTPFHPLGRCVYVHPVDDIGEAAAHVGTDVQTIAVTPWERTMGIRDSFANKGVDRFVETGMANVFRPGGSHDGIYPMSDLVRFVSVEAPSQVHGKGMVLPLDQTFVLERGQYADTVRF